MLSSKTLRKGSVALALAGALGFGPALATASAAPSPAASQSATTAASTLPVSGTVTNASGVTSTFTGALSNLTTSVVNGVLTLSGTLTGTGLPAAGVPFSAPLAPTAPGACPVLSLDLGPLHLNVLGLMVDLNEVKLDIIAVPGAGNLLGNLLCAVSHLLDNSGAGSVNGLSALLNRLLTGLGL